jgi:putative PIN family toxin of toxin-antitoxin system
VRIVLDTTVLVRANEHSQGPARDLLLGIIDGEHNLVLSNEMLHELARVLRYPRLQALYGLSEHHIYEYIGLLRHSAEIVVLSPLLITPIRDVNDVIVMQTAIIGEADVLCTNDHDFFEAPAAEYLQQIGIAVVDDIALMQRLLRQ